MNRETKQKVRIPPWMALVAVAAVAGCSSGGTEPTGGYVGPNTNTGSTAPANTGSASNDTPASSGSTGSSGSTAASSGGAAAASGTPAAASGSSGSSASSGASTATGDAGAGLGANSNAFIDIPATDLAPPDPADGIQFVTPAMAYAVQPNQEIFPNYCVVVPKDIQVGAIRSWMSPNSSHHFILYQNGTATSAATGSACTQGAGTWVYATSTPGAITGMNMPTGVGLEMPANTQLVVNMHFINPGTTVAYPQIKINILFATNVTQEASTMISFNTSIDIPPATAAGPGTQTVSGTCHAPVGANFFAMSTHTHKHATAATISYTHNGTTTELVHTGALAAGASYPADQEKGSGVDWEHPGVGSWATAPFLTAASGDTFQYSCSYANTTSSAVTVGETAASNEMCMAISYWFPASLGTASCR